MSRNLSCFGFLLCLAGAAGAAHKHGPVFAVDVASGTSATGPKITVNAAVSTQALDLKHLALSDFGDEDPVK